MNQLSRHLAENRCCCSVEMQIQMVFQNSAMLKKMIQRRFDETRCIFFSFRKKLQFKKLLVIFSDCFVSSLCLISSSLAPPNLLSLMVNPVFVTLPPRVSIDVLRGACCCLWTGCSPSAGRPASPLLSASCPPS